MERKFYTDEFEQLLKDKSDEFRMYPSKRVWHSIYNDLHPGRKWPSIAASMLLTIALLFIGFWNSNVSKPTDTASSIIPKSNLTNTALSNTITQADISKNIIVAKDASKRPEGINIITPQQNNSSIIVASSKTGTNKFKTLAPASHTLQQTDLIKYEVNYSEKIPALPESKANAITSLIKTSKLTPETTDLPEIINSDKITSIEITDLTSGNVNQNTTTIALNNTTATSDSEIKISAKSGTNANNKSISAEEKSWIENYAFHNKSKRKKWHDRSSLEIYITPNIQYRKLSNDPKYNPTYSTSSLLAANASNDAAKTVNQKPGLGFEAGVNINYSIAKNLRVKAGVQANYTNYGVIADETNHPVLTTLMLLDPISGYPYMQSAATSLSNISGSQPVKVHNKTYQVSLPVGFALKISGNNKLEWYAGATIQPSFVFGGKAYLISADRKNYVSSPSMIRKWNLNTGLETYLTYKFDGFTLLAGPEFRYQLFSTYFKKYTVKENLYSTGLKIGVVKSF